MFANIVAQRYAQAMLQSCPDLATIELVDDELTLLQAVYERSPETQGFLLNPKIPPSVKISILKSALADKLSPVVINLLVLLIEKRRQELIPEIAIRYNGLTNRVRGVENAEITIAQPISPELEKRLQDAVQRFSTRDIEVSITIDPSIIGGVKIRLGDRIVDGTLGSRFDEIRRVMLAARVQSAVPD